jgi:hypothetical protein
VVQPSKYIIDPPVTLVAYFPDEHLFSEHTVAFPPADYVSVSNSKHPSFIDISPISLDTCPDGQFIETHVVKFPPVIKNLLYMLRSF